jgi:hypothetical protein
MIGQSPPFKMPPLAKLSLLAIAMSISGVAFFIKCVLPPKKVKKD